MLIFDSRKIREQIRNIMSAQSGRRVALVAFVGQDALDFIPDPSGIEIYCADNPVATSPLGILNLLNGNGRKPRARIWFATGLHMKVFWSQNAGAFVGSANLSQNALGDGGLIEAGYFLADSSRINIDAVVRKIKAQTVVRPLPNKLSRSLNADTTSP